MIGLTSIAHALPEAVVESTTTAAEHDFDPAFIRDKLGIERRHIAGPEDTTATLAAQACDAVLEQSDTAAKDIEALIIVTQTPDYVLPHTSALVQDSVGLPNTVAAFDISLGCSGFVYGLSVAQAFMTANGFSKGLLVTSETYSRLIAPDDRATAPLFGDGATATLLDDAPLYTLGKTTFGTDGGRHDALIARGTGCKPGERESLYMDGRGIFNFMMGEMPGDIERCLAANGLEKDAIDCWVFHQASKYMLRMLSRRVGISAERVVIDLEDVGNTTSSTVPLALERNVLNQEPLPEHVFISGFGVGLSWSSGVLTRAPS
jgi:3-oxoacyl-[acyl-carrier-protein] synthase-3